tara:strand:- start:2915 stop:3187 length:273 start_codon:yes stop_codon:yes gene_type:complete
MFYISFGMIWEIILYIFLLVAFVAFIKASEVKFFRKRLSFWNRLLIALIFPLLAVILFVFGVFIIVLIILVFLVGFVFFLFGGRMRFKRV